MIYIGKPQKNDAMIMVEFENEEFLEANHLYEEISNDVWNKKSPLALDQVLLLPMIFRVNYKIMDTELFRVMKPHEYQREILFMN